MKGTELNNTPEAIRRKSLLADLEAAFLWIGSLGIDSTKGRFASYVRHVEELENKNNSNAEIDEGAYDSAIEASDLVLIYKGLSGLPDKQLVDRLKIFLNGPIHSVDENPLGGASYMARSIGIELVAASLFRMGGFQVGLDSLADVEVVDGDTLFHVECKRPSKYETVDDCIDEAYSQLKKRYERYNGPYTQRGFVFLSLTKVVNPENRELRLSDETMLNNTLQDILKRFSSEHKRLFYSKLDPRTMAVFVFLQAAISLTGLNGIFIQRQLSGTYVSDTNDPDIKNRNPDRIYFNEIVSRLTQGFQQEYGREV